MGFASTVFFQTLEFRLIRLPFLVGQLGENSSNLQIEGGGLHLPLDPDNGGRKGKCEIRTCGLLEGSRNGREPLFSGDKNQTEDF